MRNVDVHIGSVYVAKVSGKLTRVRITAESPYGGWDAVSLGTNRRVRIRSPQRLRQRVDTEQQTPTAQPSPPRAHVLNDLWDRRRREEW